MTIFRVNTLRDKATIIKALPKTVENDSGYTPICLEMFSLEEDLRKAVGPLQKKLLTKSRQVYTKSDKALKLLNKDKAANKDEIQTLLGVRKRAYSLGIILKDPIF